MKKTILLSLMASSLLAEDDGVFMSVGYQIGEAAQMVKNTGEIQKVSNAYENLNNLLTRYAITNSNKRPLTPIQAPIKRLTI